MKKNKSLIILLSMFICLTCIMLAGCSTINGTENDNNNTDSEAEQPCQPQLNYNTLVWSPIKDATKYNIYANDKLIKSTTELGTILDLEPNTYSISLEATLIDGTVSEKLDAGTCVIPSYETTCFTSFAEFDEYKLEDDNCIYLHDIEHVSLVFSDVNEYLDGYTFYVSDTVKKITIKSNKLVNIKNCNFIIQQRNDEIYFSFENVSIRTATNQKSFIEFSQESLCKDAILQFDGKYNSLGTNYIANNGEKGFDGSNSVHAGHGKNGEDGGDAIVTDNLFIINNGILVITAGNGGNGGNGGNQVYGSISKHGDGGNGGNGGNGIKCNNLSIFNNGQINSFGGKGGIGGIEGRDGFGNPAGGNGNKGANGLDIICPNKTILYELIDKNFNPNIEVPQPMLLGSIVYWPVIKNAEIYLVYINGVANSVNTTRCGYDTKQVNFIQVSAVVNGEESKKSVVLMTELDPETITIETVEQYNQYFKKTDDGVLLHDIDGVYLDYVNYSSVLPHSNIINIDSTVKYIKITTPSSGIISSFNVEPRTTSLIIELNNAKIKSFNNHNGITATGVLPFNMPNVIIRSNGQNEIIGGNNAIHGENASGYNFAGYGNTGGNGNPGFSAINSPVLLIEGTNGLSLQGGDASDGGDGGNAKKMLGIWQNEGGHGGNGGNGGNGIQSDTIYINISTGGHVYTYGGKGGNPGNKGKGLNFNNDAKPGNNGIGYKGKVITIVGQIS